MTREREYRTLNRRGGEGGGRRREEEMGEAEVGEPHATLSTGVPRDGLRGCITCLLPDHKPPTKTLMSNVNGDNASDPFSTRDLFTRDWHSKNIEVASSQQKRIIFFL